jgi:hypothetical protein
MRIPSIVLTVDRPRQLAGLLGEGAREWTRISANCEEENREGMGGELERESTAINAILDQWLLALMSVLTPISAGGDLFQF